MENLLPIHSTQNARTCSTDFCKFYNFSMDSLYANRSVLSAIVRGNIVRSLKVFSIKHLINMGLVSSNFKTGFDFDNNSRRSLFKISNFIESKLRKDISCFYSTQPEARMLSSINRYQSTHCVAILTVGEEGSTLHQLLTRYLRFANYILEKNYVKAYFIIRLKSENKAEVYLSYHIGGTTYWSESVSNVDPYILIYHLPLVMKIITTLLRYELARPI
jgi:hypothetical protein